MLTMKDVKEATLEVKSMAPKQRGRFWLMPPVTLQCVADAGSIKAGTIVNANRLDENGLSPGTVCLQENDQWLPVEKFELV